MDSHFEIQTTILDIPDDTINNQISKYLLENKAINKLFYDKEDYYLLNFLCGKIWMLNMLSLNLYGMNSKIDCIKTYLYTRHDLN